jgi:hypothetical protein
MALVADRFAPPASQLAKSAEHGAEKCVTPGRLQESARIRQKRWDAELTARRVVTVDDGAERIKTDVLGEHRQPRCPPAGAARHCLTKHGDVGVIASQKPLVDRFLQRPHRRSRSRNTG